MDNEKLSLARELNTNIKEHEAKLYELEKQDKKNGFGIGGQSVVWLTVEADIKKVVFMIVTEHIRAKLEALKKQFAEL